MTTRENEKIAKLYKAIGWTCPHGCINGILPKMSQGEYRRARGIWMVQGGLEPWPEAQPDLPCCHTPDPLANPADTLDLLESCGIKIGSSESILLRWNDGCWVATLFLTDWEVTAPDMASCVVRLACKLWEIE